MIDSPAKCHIQPPRKKQPDQNPFQCHILCLLDDSGLQALGVRDVDGLDVRVQLLLSLLLVVTLTRDAHTQAAGNALDAAFPDLLVELGVEADVAGALLIETG